MVGQAQVSPSAVSRLPASSEKITARKARGLGPSGLPMSRASGSKIAAVAPSSPVPLLIWATAIRASSADGVPSKHSKNSPKSACAPV